MSQDTFTGTVPIGMMHSKTPSLSFNVKTKSKKGKRSKSEASLKRARRHRVSDVVYEKPSDLVIHPQRCTNVDSCQNMPTAISKHKDRRDGQRSVDEQGDSAKMQRKAGGQESCFDKHKATVPSMAHEQQKCVNTSADSIYCFENYKMNSCQDFERTGSSLISNKSPGKLHRKSDSKALQSNLSYYEKKHLSCANERVNFSQNCTCTSSSLLSNTSSGKLRSTSGYETLQSNPISGEKKRLSSEYEEVNSRQECRCNTSSSFSNKSSGEMQRKSKNEIRESSLSCDEMKRLASEEERSNSCPDCQLSISISNKSAGKLQRKCDNEILQSNLSCDENKHLSCSRSSIKRMQPGDVSIQESESYKEACSNDRETADNQGNEETIGNSKKSNPSSLEKNAAQEAAGMKVGNSRECCISVGDVAINIVEKPSTTQQEQEAKCGHEKELKDMKEQLHGISEKYDKEKISMENLSSEMQRKLSTFEKDEEQEKDMKGRNEELMSLLKNAYIELDDTKRYLSEYQEGYKVLKEEVIQQNHYIYY